MGITTEELLTRLRVFDPEAACVAVFDIEGDCAFHIPETWTDQLKAVGDGKMPRMPGAMWALLTLVHILKYGGQDPEIDAFMARIREAIIADLATEGETAGSA